MSSQTKSIIAVVVENRSDEYEQKAQELMSQTTVFVETIETLQNNLISEKVTNEKFKTNLDKLGLSLDILDNDINVVVEKMLLNPDFVKNITNLLHLEEPKETKTSGCKKCSGIAKDEDDVGDVYKQTEQVVSSISAEWNMQCEKLMAEVSNLQQLNEILQTDNAKMQVSISTLTSQVNSLSTQQTALQLANSQLVAEKEEVSLHSLKPFI